MNLAPIVQCVQCPGCKTYVPIPREALASGPSAYTVSSPVNSTIFEEPRKSIYPPPLPPPYPAPILPTVSR